MEHHVASCGVSGFIWAQPNDTVDLLTVEEKKSSFTALAKAFAGSSVYVTLGCQGRDTTDMETLARHVEGLAVSYPTTKLLIACRPPLDARTIPLLAHVGIKCKQVLMPNCRNMPYMI